MILSSPIVPPICPVCGRFLRNADEQQRGYCMRCPAPAASNRDADERPCCHSDPPCDDCPFGSAESDKVTR